MSHQAGPSAADSPALLITTTTVHKYAMKKKEILNAEESELYELSQAAGITVDQEVFKIMVDLLKMNVAPQAVFQTLKAMCAGQRVPESCSGDTTVASHVTGIPLTKAEARAQQDESLSSGKSAKMPAGAPAGPAPRGTRISAKMAAYGTQDAGSAPHAQAGRSKAASSSSSATPADKTREASGQRAQRQPSASRGQKTKSSGSSSSSSQM